MPEPRVARRMTAALLLLTALVRCAVAAEAPAKIHEVEGITEYRLANGLQILLFPDPSASTVTVNLTVFCGSRHEGYGEAGMAHLLEHMVFKGTPRHADIPKALRDHGANFNGTTWLDRTNYFETMPASDANLEFGIALEADRLVNSLIRKEDLDSEMTVVRNEFESGENNPQGVLFRRMLAVAYEWHNYGKSTIGNRSDIERVPVDNLREFYRRFYQPDNCMLVVAGKFEPAKALELAVKHFGVLPKPTRKLNDTYTEEPAQDGERVVVLRRVGKVGAVGAVYHVPAGSHPDFPALEVLAEVLDTEPSGRLYKTLVETKKSSSAGASAMGLHDPGIFIAIAQVEGDKPIDEVRDALTDTLENLGKQPLTDEEVERAKRKMLKDRELLMTNTGRIAVTLSDWGAKGDWRLFFLHRDRVAKVTAADVNRVATTYLKRNNRTAGVYIPTDNAERVSVPATPSLAETLKNYKGSQTVTEGEVFEPTPENIEKRVTRSTSATGLKVALLPKKSRGNTVSLQLSLRYGNEKSLLGKTTAADFVSDMLERGTTKHTRQQLQDEFDKLKAQVGFGGQPGLLTVGIETKRESLPAVVALVGEMLREPSFPADELDVLKRQTLESLRRNLPEPSAKAQSWLRRHMSPYPKTDVRYVETPEESIASIEAVTRDAILEVYKQQFGGGHGELVVVGDFDTAIVGDVDRILSGWKSGVEFRRIAKPAITDVAGARERILTPDKANAVFVAAHAFELADTHPDYVALRVADFIFGEAPLSSRLSNRVRGKEGLSYGVGSQLQVHPVDKAGMFLMFAITNPANIDKVDKAVAEELEKMLKTGADTKEVDEAKAAFLAQMKVSRSTDRSIASLLANGLFTDRDMSYYSNIEKRVSELTADQVNAAFRKYVDPKKLSIVHAGDFKAAPAVEPKK